MDLATVATELEQHRRSLSMLPPGSPITRETALDVIEHCQRAIAAARRQHPSARPTAL